MNLQRFFRVFILVVLALRIPYQAIAEKPFFEISTVRDSEPGTNYYLNRYGVMSPLPDGRVFVIWSAAAGWAEGDSPNTLPKGRIVGAFSADNGKTWSTPQLLIASPDRNHNDLDPHMVLEGKRIFVFSTTVERPFRHVWIDTWMTKSEDGGRTWSKQVKFPRLRTYLVGRRHIGLHLKDGALAIPASWPPDAEGKDLEPSQIKWKTDATLMVSTDRGKTWQLRSNITECGGSCAEPAIVQLENGELFMLIRNPGERFYETRSRDNGFTWDLPRLSPLIAHNSPAALWKLKNGALVVAWDNSPKNRWPLDVAYSLDGGHSWSAPRTIVDNGYQTSYPAVTEARDGTILVTWQNAPGHQKGADLKLARFNFQWLKEGH